MSLPTSGRQGFYLRGIKNIHHDRQTRKLLYGAPPEDLSRQNTLQPEGYKKETKDNDGLLLLCPTQYQGL